MDQLNDRSVVEQRYATATNLQTRISIHDKYSTNKMGFGNWIFSNYKIDPGMRVLELGCGTGDMWKNKEDLIRLCSRLTLSDFSKAMIAAAKSNIGEHENVEYKAIDIQEISYKNETFDVVIANMMLYHVPDLAKGLAEVRRVLKKGGFFYCATYGEHGMVEYLSKILSVPENDTNKNFTLQNGSEILHKTFSNVQKLEYTDSLPVTNIDDMIEYLYSLSSMTSITGIPKQAKKDILTAHTTNGILNVPKEYGMFIVS